MYTFTNNNKDTEIKSIKMVFLLWERPCIAEDIYRLVVTEIVGEKKWRTEHIIMPEYQVPVRI